MTKSQSPFLLFFSLFEKKKKTEHLIADEFSAELADGVAYVAGHDQEARPVMVIANFSFPSVFHVFFHKQKKS